MAEDADLKPLPKTPYKGLTFYTAADAPLFAGRETAVEQCAALIRQESTRILLLHGSTACGKSSFLQAGLIPYLETKRYQVDRFRDEAIFVTATWEPLRQLVSFIYTLADTARPLSDSSGKQGIGGMVLDPEGKKLTQEQFIQARGSSAENVLDILAQLSTWLVRRFIIVIDQAEEVLTLRPGPNGDKPREEFFRFLALFPKRQLPIKLLIAMRTEYFGKFVARSRESYDEPFVICDYYLNELTQDQLTQAILKPTEDIPIPGYRSTPFQTYRFSYQNASDEKEGAAQKIAASLTKTFSAGGALPVMQIVCANLYKSAVSQGRTAQIPAGDYSSGQLEREIAAYLNQTLEEMCAANSIPTGQERVTEVRKWERVLAKLASAGPDGTVTTRVLRAERLARDSAKRGCVIPFAAAADFLKNPERRLLRDRSIYIPDKPDKNENGDKGATIPCFSLGHDAIGLVVLRIVDARIAASRKAKEAMQKELELAAQQARFERARRISLSTVRFFYGALGLGFGVWTAVHWRANSLKDDAIRIAIALFVILAPWSNTDDDVTKINTLSDAIAERGANFAKYLLKYTLKYTGKVDKSP